MSIKLSSLVVLIANLIVLAYTDIYTLRCLSCNSISENCLENFKKTAKVWCDDEDSCVTYIDTNSTIFRGCSSEMDEDVIAFKTCNSSDFCNNDRVCLDTPNNIFCADENSANESVQFSCIECDSEKGDQCQLIQSGQQQIVCKESPQTGCYHFEKGTTIKRGCLSNLSKNSKMFQDCEDGIDCKMCDEKNCNTRKSLPKCYACSSAENVACATVKGDLPEKTCNDYFDTCKVYVKPNSTTHRGCSMEIDDPEIKCSSQTVNCKECSDNLCNGGVFPVNRLTCYVCRDLPTSDCSLNITDAMIQPCEKYNFRDSCFLFMDKNNLTIRGCLSDDNFFSRDLCEKQPNQCDVCQSPNCNMKSVMRKPEMSCIKCDTSTDPKCIWGFSESSKTSCSKNVMHYEEESCFTLQVSEKSLIRGCTLDSNICRGLNSCQICKGIACNNQKQTQQYCIECNSEDDEKCYDKPTELKNASCNGNIVYEYRGCYTWKHDKNQISRGCFSELSAAKKFECINSQEHCKICHQNNTCNIIPSNKSNNLQFFKFLLILTTLTLF